MRKILSTLLRPIPAETRRLLAERWQALPPELRDERQVVGRHMTHCGYTMGAAYCSFGCTHCYLPSNSNRVPLPSLEEMKDQIDANRRLLGQGGGLQITGGDVVDAYVCADRRHELVELLAYANRAGVVPMLMTHGQGLLDDPDYFAELVQAGGLRKVSLHIDITQAGRPGYPIRTLESEADLHPLRQRFVDLVLEIRRRTGHRISAAQTVTVTERNIDSLDEILRWMREDPSRPDVFHTLSFQTEAAVGRTRFSATPVTPDRAWERISKGLEIDLPTDGGLRFGHPDCSRVSTLLTLYPSGRVLDLTAADRESRQLWSEILATFGGMGGRGDRPWESRARKLALVARRPSVLAKVTRYAWRRMRREGLGPQWIWHWARGRARGFNVVLHNFMHADEMTTPREARVEERLAACMFKGAVRSGDGWEAVPMCEMNGAAREAIYSAEIRAAEGLVQIGGAEAAVSGSADSVS